jgi:glycosyltransferase involved in cell wall biosynthesis
MNLCFILPAFTRRAQGGYKMVFEYSNRLCLRGHNVTILFLNEDALKNKKLPSSVKALIANYLTAKGPNWFTLDSKINLLSSLKNGIQNKLKNIDIAVATAIETVEYVDIQFPEAKKAYFIQGFENWNCSNDDVLASYSKGFNNIVISSWLKNIVDQYSVEPAALIQNPVDTNIYKEIVPLDKRRKHSIALLYHQNPIKGFDYAFKVLEKLKEMYSDLTVEMFGIFPRPDYFPSYIHYTRSATQEQTVEIYNKVQVFLCATIEEGYGLTGLEAMACGTALVSTDYKGAREYAENNKNALLSPVKNVDNLVDNVAKLFENDILRMKIAKEGILHVQSKFSWENAVDKFEEALNREK